MTIPFYAKRFISGETFTEAFDVVKSLNQKGIAVTLDVLGENITKKEQAMKFAEEYMVLLKEIRNQNLNCYVSVKLTMLGLDINESFCYENLSKILSVADEIDSRVAFDMEGSGYTERTIAMYEKAAKEFKSPEIVIQAYLHRTEKDLSRVVAANGRMRLCKGAYKETSEVASQKMSDIVELYKRYVENLLTSGKRICIASHDDDIINYCMEFIHKNSIPKERYEFQMLYGMREKTWSKIVEKGHNMTIYVPYGKDWKAYYLRRLSERKENVFFVLKNFFRS